MSHLHCTDKHYSELIGQGRWLQATPRGKENLICNIYFLGIENSAVFSSFHTQGFDEMKQSYFLGRKMKTVIRSECHNYTGLKGFFAVS